MRSRLWNLAQLVSTFRAKRKQIYSRTFPGKKESFTFPKNFQLKKKKLHFSFQNAKTGNYFFKHYYVYIFVSNLYKCSNQIHCICLHFSYCNINYLKADIIGLCYSLTRYNIADSPYPTLMLKLVFDPPGYGWIGANYFHAWCPYVRLSVTKIKTSCNANVGARKIKYGATTDTFCEDNDHLLAVAWWVTLNSLDLLFYSDGRTDTICEIMTTYSVEALWDT